MPAGLRIGEMALAVSLVVVCAACAGEPSDVGRADAATDASASPDAQPPIDATACVQSSLPPLAQSGTLELASVEGSLTGTAANLVLAEYDKGPDTLIPGGCTTTIDSFSFDTAIVVVEPF